MPLSIAIGVMTAINAVNNFQSEMDKSMKSKLKLAGNNPKKDRRTDKGVAKGPTKGYHKGQGK